MSAPHGRSPRRRRSAREARLTGLPPTPSSAGRRWPGWALVLAALVGAWIGRQVTILPETGTRLFDIAIAVGIAAIVALGYRRLAQRYRRLRRERSIRR